MILSQILTSIAVVIIKQLKGFSGIDIVQIRTYFLFLMNWPLVQKERQDVVQPLKERTNRILVFRTLLCAFQIVFWIKSLQMINISDSMVLSNTTPIWNVLYFIFLAKQNVDRKTIYLIITSFLGMVMIVRSSYQSHSYDSSLSEEEIWSQRIQYLIGCGYSIASAILLAYVFYQNHLLNSEISVPVLLHYFYLGSLLYCGFLNVLNGDLPAILKLLDLRSLLVFTVMSLIMYSYQFFQNWALSLKPGYLILPFHYLQTVNGFLSDTLFFNNKITFFQVLGSVIIVTCCILI